MAKKAKTLRGRLFAVAVVATAVATLSACDGGDKEPSISVAQAAEQARQAAAAALRQGEQTEAAKADSRLAAAKAELGKLAADTARAGKFAAKANCDVAPDGFSATTAVKSFPGHARGMYRDACRVEVDRLVAERKDMAERAVAKAKAREQKLAAAKPKSAVKPAAHHEVRKKG